MTELFMLVGGVLVSAVLALGAFWFGGKNQKQKDEIEELNRRAATKDRMDDTFKDHVGDDPAVARDFLRARGKRG